MFKFIQSAKRLKLLRDQLTQIIASAEELKTQPVQVRANYLLGNVTVAHRHLRIYATPRGQRTLLSAYVHHHPLPRFVNREGKPVERLAVSPSEPRFSQAVVMALKESVAQPQL